jgi:hypothetical protein
MKKCPLFPCRDDIYSSRVNVMNYSAHASVAVSLTGRQQSSPRRFVIIVSYRNDPRYRKLPVTGIPSRHLEASESGLLLAPAAGR